MRQLTPADMRDWARHAHGSPLYAGLSEVVARSEELMRVINRVQNRPPPNVLFAAVQFLLMRGEDAGLARFYPSLVDDPLPAADIADPFEEFVLAHEETIVELGRTRYTQTNESRRCVALLPAMWRTGVSRFHLVDVGTSAGLNLLVDRYRYRWDGIEWGPESPLVLETELRGEPPVPREIEVLTRTGLDLNPVDINDADDRLWLESLVWPEHAERRRRLDSALQIAQSVEIDMVAGSALDTLQTTLDSLPADDPVVVMHSFTLNQFTAEGREEFEAILESARRRRRVERVFFEHMRREDSWHKIGVDTDGDTDIIGQGHPHGEWVELYARP